MCFVWIWEQTAIISLYSINWLVCITETESVYCAVRTECSNCIPLNISLHKDSGVVTSIVLRVPGTGSKQLDPRETDPNTRCREGPRTGLNWCGKPPPPTGFDPPTIQPVASRYTDWAVPAHNFTSKETEIRTISNVEEYEEWRFSLVYVHGTAVRVHFVANAAAVRQEDGAIADVCAASWMERGGPSETKIKLN